MHFSPEINLGTVVEIAVFIVVVFGAAMKFGKLEAKLNIMYAWFEDAVVQGAGRSRKESAERFYGDQ